METKPCDDCIWNSCAGKDGGCSCKCHAPVQPLSPTLSLSLIDETIHAMGLHKLIMARLAEVVPEPTPAASSEVTAEKLEKEWRSQPKILSYTNWLQAQLISALSDYRILTSARSAAPTPAASSEVAGSAEQFYRHWTMKGREEFCEQDEEVGVKFAEAFAAEQLVSAREDQKRVSAAVNVELAKLRADWNAALRRAEKAEAALREIAKHKPKVKPEEKDGVWGNEDDAEYHGYQDATWFLGEIAQSALNPPANVPQASAPPRSPETPKEK